MKFWYSILLLILPQCHASPLYLFTGQSGAQTQIDTDHTSSWVLTPTGSLDIGGGLFTMKAGSNASESVRFSLFQGTDSGGILIGSTILTNLMFCSQSNNCGQFGAHQFLFDSAVSLSAGETYFAQLTSTAPDVQSKAYFIKSTSVTISDLEGARIEPQPVTFGMPLDTNSATSVPEPQTLIVSALGLGLIVLGKRGRHLRV